MVEGRSSQTLRNNHSNHPIQLVENITRSDPQHGISVRFKIGLAQVIDLCGFVSLVNFSIDFDQQARRETCEVSDVSADGMLAAKFESIWPNPESLPKQHFG
jgi:hypothetical protein